MVWDLGVHFERAPRLVLLTGHGLAHFSSPFRLGFVWGSQRWHRPAPHSKNTDCSFSSGVSCQQAMSTCVSSPSGAGFSNGRRGCIIPLFSSCYSHKRLSIRMVGFVKASRSAGILIWASSSLTTSCRPHQNWSTSFQAVSDVSQLKCAT